MATMAAPTAPLSALPSPLTPMPVLADNRHAMTERLVRGVAVLAVCLLLVILVWPAAVTTTGIRGFGGTQAQGIRGHVRRLYPTGVR